MTTLDEIMKEVEGGSIEADEANSQTSQGPRPVHISYQDPTTEELMHLAEVSGVTSFWDDPDEDIYTMGDGEPA